MTKKVSVGGKIRSLRESKMMDMEEIGRAHV
mgnify:CR=1 FL=1